MKKNNIISKALGVLIIAVALTGCGSKEAVEEPAADVQTERAEKEDTKEAEDKKDNEEEKPAASPADVLVGEWQFAYQTTHSEYEDSDDYYGVVVCTDEDIYMPNTSVTIRKDGDKFLADYMYDYDIERKKYNGVELTYKKEKPFPDAESDWYLELKDPFDEEAASIRFSAEKDDELTAYSEYSNDPDEGYEYYTKITKEVYLPKDSSRFDDPDSLMYFDTVTVGSARELLNSIQSNRKIILKEGFYDFSDIPAKAIDNRYVKMEYDDGPYEVKNAAYLCLEAQDGADVEFSISEAYNPVFSFDGGRYITLRGITAGHNVEPGYCSGSVLNFKYADHVSVDKCSLYGSGTYGVETMYTGNISVTDTDIYECTYGLVSMSDGYGAEFKNCTMRDSSDLSMLYIHGMEDTLFEGCTFSNNRADAYDTVYFADIGDYDRVTFKDCDFDNNKYNTFSNLEVTLENCTSNENQATFRELISSPGKEKIPDMETLVKNYEETLKKSNEIDEEFENSFLDQQSMNKLAYEKYNLWDVLLNQIWAFLEDSLTEDRFEKLRAEQKQWIEKKEKAMKDAGKENEGGSLQPLMEYGKGSEVTQERVEELMKKFEIK